jgi:tetratricopeptide (TPR) repeat protein
MDRLSADPRVIRVFVSSTFRDMQAERDELVKRTFPALRKLCESRGVTWGEVDLRWGVTDEQEAEGQVLPICLAEIARCRPYFIGILGERYGWVPDVLEPALVEQEPWLAGRVGRSVTELEILHGALNNPVAAKGAFFYLRDPGYVSGNAADQFREIPTTEEIARLGPQEAERQAAERRAKLADLKARIRASGLPVHEDYPDPRVLGEAVLADLAAVIDHLYPDGSTPDPLDREAAEQEAFARSRAGVYIGRPEYVERLDAHAAGDGPPLVILGESGSGKSALLANWAFSYRAAHPDDQVVLHFVGASPASTDWRAMIRRIIGELSRRFGLATEIPDEPDALRLSFANALHMAAAKGRLVLILDALDQLEDREGALDLAWLPPAIPPNVRLVLSTLPGRSLTDLLKRAYPTLAVQSLEPAERERLIVDYLASYAKVLSPAMREHIAASPRCANPLYLRAVLDELRMWGEHETLSPRIDHYLAAQSVESLYELILERYEADYDRDRPGLVGDAFSLMWAARRGLSESELLDLLGADGQPLPRAYWSPLFVAAESSLASRSGLVGFFHEYLRQAVEHRYLPDEHAQQTFHLRLADYFASREIGPRKIDELPWQLARAQAWQRLYDLLADLTFLEAASDADHFEVRASWAKVEASSPLRMVDAYRSLLDAPVEHATSQVFMTANLLREIGHPEQALPLQEHLVRRYRQTGDRVNLAASLGNQAVILKARGDLDEALDLLREAEEICRELGNRGDLQASLGNQALILRARGDLSGAMAMHKEEERICRELGDRGGLSGSLGNQAIILRANGDLDGALALEKEQERICRELGDPAGLQVSLGNQANILFARGEFEKALDLHKEEERICRELGDPASLQASLGNQALILKARGDLDGALDLHKEEERICRELGDPASLQASLGNQGLILRARGDLDGAMALYVEQERICRALDDPAGLQAALGNQAVILQARGDLDGALVLIDEQERICRKLGDPAGLQAALANRANALLARGELAGAMALYKEQEEICRKLDYLAGLQVSLGNQGVILKRQGDLPGAMLLHKEEEGICRQLGDPEALATSLANQASLLGQMGRQREALPLAEEAYRLANQHGLTSLSLQIQPLVETFR